MTISIVKTDNTYLADKVGMRIRHLPPGKHLRVLDLFAGTGYIWKQVRAKAKGRTFSITGIDKKPMAGTATLRGDNRKYIDTMDLSQFDIIDMDGYGAPYAQLKTILAKARNVTVFLTWCQISRASVPQAMLQDYGYSKTMVARCPTLFNRNNIEKLRYTIAKAGIREFYIKSNRDRSKNYLAIPIGKDKAKDEQKTE